jgi:predicted O-methyltransferase YrrM
MADHMIDDPKARLAEDTPGGSIVGSDEAIVSPEYDLERLRERLAEVLSIAGTIGALNPRLPGLHNDIVQYLKKVMRRSLDWYTRPLLELHTAIIACLAELAHVLSDIEHKLERQKFHTDQGEAGTAKPMSSGEASHAVESKTIPENWDGTQIIALDFPVRAKSRYGYGKPPHSELHRIIARNHDSYRRTLQRFASFNKHLVKIPDVASATSSGPVWLNEWISPFDATSLYCLISINAPKQYVEVGSGYSTKFAKSAIFEQRLGTKITSIDPEPRADVASICDVIIRKPLENVEIELFDELESGDVLFIDSSHRCFMNSDVTVCFLDILPRIKPGVLVHFHDIFLPYDYPPEWAARYYSEQYLLAASLLAGDAHFEIVLPNAFLCRDPELCQILYSLLWSDHKMRHMAPHGGSFWMRKK